MHFYNNKARLEDKAVDLYFDNQYQVDHELDMHIKAVDISKDYGGNAVLESINMEFRPGKITGLLGPNGAGKSTLINILTGLNKASSGTFVIDSQTFAHIPNDFRTRIGVMPQDIIVFEDLTIQENLRMMAVLYRIPSHQINQRISQIIQDLALESHQNQQARKLSGGYKRRLHLACSMLHEPEVMFLDEPSPGIDPQSRRFLWDYIIDMRQQNKTVILTDHYLDEAEKLCDYVYIIDAGRVVAQGTVPELIQEHIPTSLIRVQFEGEFKIPPQYQEHVILQKDGFSLKSTSNPQSDIRYILEFVEQTQAQLIDLELKKGMLEDVFMLLTGKELRD